MTVKIIGLIRLKDPAAFEIYRSQVGATVEKYQGSVVARGVAGKAYWNELPCGEFTAFVELHFRLPLMPIAGQRAQSIKRFYLYAVRRWI